MIYGDIKLLIQVIGNQLSEGCALVNKNWTQIFNFYTTKIDFLCNTMDFLIHPCLAEWSVSGILRL